MNRKLILTIVLFAAACSAGVPTSEASMNFDLKNVRPFLERLNSEAGLGLDVDKLNTFTRDTKVGEERSISLKVKFQGKEIGLEYRILMDDVDAPDLYFFTESKALADTINKQMIDFSESLGV